MNLLTRIFCLFIFFSPPTILAIETVRISGGVIDPVPIALNKFDSKSSRARAFGEKIREIISNDLRNSGILRPISEAAFIDRKIGIAHRPTFVAWRQLGTGFLVNGFVSETDKGNLKVEFILWDNFLEKELLGEELEASEGLLRRVAHKIADKIYEKITGDFAYFDSKVTFIAESGPYTKRVKRLAVMDYDGANFRYLTDGKSLVLTPRFSPKADKILYLSYADRRAPGVHLKDLKNGTERILGKFKGMTFSPRFSPDGTKALMSLSKWGSTNIYEMDLRTKNIKQLTYGQGVINTSPSYSPDGRKIVFNSDRTGARHLYVMNSDGSDVKRISFGTGIYAAPAWSPKGDYIAFTKKTREEGFTIGIMRPDGEENRERILATGYLVEGPCWSPGGRIIMFARGEPPSKRLPGKNRIFVIDVNGYNEREMPISGDASDPEWSRLLE